MTIKEKPIHKNLSLYLTKQFIITSCSFSFSFSPLPLSLLYSRCSFSIMVKWTNDGLFQANSVEMLVNDDEMLVNDGEMSTYIIIYSFHHHWLASHHH